VYGIICDVVSGFCGFVAQLVETTFPRKSHRVENCSVELLVTEYPSVEFGFLTVCGPPEVQQRQREIWYKFYERYLRIFWPLGRRGAGRPSAR
jgi:hypothetical protein